MQLEHTRFQGHTNWSSLFILWVSWDGNIPCIFCFVQSLPVTNAEEVIVVFAMLDKITGVPYGGLWTCTVGFSLTCGHIGVTLFRLCDPVASGIKEDYELACTDVLCGGASASATIFDELKISKKWTTLEGPKVTLARRSVIQIHSSLMLFLRWKRTYFKPHTTCISIAQL